MHVRQEEGSAVQIGQVRVVPRKVQGNTFSGALGMSSYCTLTSQLGAVWTLDGAIGSKIALGGCQYSRSSSSRELDFVGNSRAV